MWRRFITPALFVGLFCVAPSRSEAQTLTQRGFAEARVTFYPQDAPNDRVNGVADLLLRDDAFLKPAPWIQFAAGLDLRLNTHDQVQGSWRIDIGDRGRLRPAVSIRRLTGTLTRGPMTIDVGKQFIRWGKTDIVTPTDRFAPRDFLNVLDADFLAVSGARGVLQLGTHTLDLVWVPFFTPSRVPLLNQRWAPVPSDSRVISLNEIAAAIPDGSQAGMRYSRTADRFALALRFRRLQPPAERRGCARAAPRPVRSRVAVSVDAVVWWRCRHADALVHHQGRGGVFDFRHDGHR